MLKEVVKCKGAHVWIAIGSLRHMCKALGGSGVTMNVERVSVS